VLCECSKEQTEAYFVQITPPAMVLFQKDLVFVLTLVPSGSGAKYTGKDDNGIIEFWSKGQEALLTLWNNNTIKCIENEN
jgi:membrane-bound inhibitor of C-type lysozyme